MGKIKVLHIIKSLGRGGAEMLLPETLKLHDQEKFEFHYLYFLSWKDQMVEAIKAAGGKVTCFEASGNIRLMLQHKKVLTYCRKEKIDLIHCHLPWAGFLGRSVHFRLKIPLLYTEHNMQERYHPVTRTINKLTFNYQSAAIGVSNDVSNSIEHNIKPKIPVITLLNGVNTDAFVRCPGAGEDIRNQLGIPADSIVIGNVAVFRFQKRIVEWLEVFKDLSKNNNRVYGIVVGAGPLEDEIKAEAKKLGLEGKVFFPGLITEVKPYFSMMDIFMMSSSFEGLPIALLEAMSMECAVVSTNAGGIKEVITDKKDGLLCDVEEWQSLSNLCQVLIEDEAKLLDLKKAARMKVVLDFSLVRMVKELEDLYVDQM
ncbi:glycosyltransferase [Salinimicrobium sediminilitoris]|uniref:glycosyltransferase n=1 Tax=Salinimicrobium sediminilitoris TaxID=2876715 RepID=UPI001E64AA21|nr:glycosyltransferase [Salinimicrobium sediminilitoris]MCC8358737.1 glycosyltransferase [Salinimicrobium sediminilitoris]